MDRGELIKTVLDTKAESDAIKHAIRTDLE
jgi:hypothetical protein